MYMDGKTRLLVYLYENHKNSLYIRTSDIIRAGLDIKSNRAARNAQDFAHYDEAGGEPDERLLRRLTRQEADKRFCLNTREQVYVWTKKGLCEGEKLLQKKELPLFA